MEKTMMTKLQQLATLGQSIWYDNIRRAMLDHGDLQALVDAGVTGVTSNPSIFEKAIAGSADHDEAMGELVTEGRSELATTVGYGPRFLHSTGQLHKGDRGNGLFIQFTSDPLRDVAIPAESGKPDSAMTFGLLKMAQVLGDKQALLDNEQRVIRFHLGSDVVGSLRKLAEMLA